MRRSLKRLGDLYRIPIVLDRRIDPSRELNLAVQDSPFVRVVAAAAVQLDVRVEPVGSCLYVGPKETAAYVPLLIQLAESQIETLPKQKQTSWRAVFPVQVAHLTSPRDLVKELCTGRRIDIANLERVPHDLWPEQNWGSLTLAESLALILIGFDMTFEINDVGDCTARPVDTQKRVTLTHDSFGDDQGGQLAEIVEGFRGAKIDGTTVTLAASLETHAELRRRLQSLRVESKGRSATAAPSPGRPLPKQTYSLEVKNQPLGPVVTQLCMRLGLQLQFADNITKADRDRLVSFQVQNATLEQLFAAMVAGTDLKAEFKDGILTLRR
ncbi:MAG: STN domain-containing protein [Planctomycetales bacterium]|nr:STN domain-containing protein [Planctomycetales bacterium]